MVEVRSIMSEDVITVEPEMSLREAVDVLRKGSFSGAPVVAAGEVLGVISATDILEFEASTPGAPTEREDQVELGEWGSPEPWEEGADPPARFFTELWSDAGADVVERFDETESPEWDILEDYSVGEVMTRTVISVSPDADIREAAARMAEAEVHRILVLDDHSIAGIVTTTDIVRAVAEGTV